MENGAAGEEHHDAGIGDTEGEHFRRIGEQPEKGLDEKQAEQDKQQGMDAGQEEAVRHGAVRLVPVARAELPGNVGVEPHAGADGQGQDKVLDRKGIEDRQIGAVADLCDEHAVHNVVQRLDEHGENRWEGHAHQQGEDTF